MGFQIVKLTDPIQFTNVSGGLVPKGAYAAGTDYTVGDSVDYNGSSYVMFADAAAGTLPTDTTKWQVLANKGDTGATGPQGPAGTTDYNELVNLPTLGTAAAKDIPATGNASATEVVYGTDTRLTDSRPASDVSAWAKAPTKPAYNNTEVGAAATVHTHAISDTTNLQTSLDGKVDENTAITGATKTKITYDAKGLVTAGADATTADIADSTDKRYITDAQLAVVSNTSGTNSGDNATNSQYSGLAASKQDTDATLTALAAHNTNGILTQTAADTFTGRTITGTTNQITVTDGDGVAGNPTLALPQDIHTGASPSFTGISVGGAANLRPFNIKGSGLNARFNIQGTTPNDSPGIEFTNDGNANRALIRMDSVSTTGTSLTLWTESISGGIENRLVIDSSGNTYPGTDSTYTLGTSSLYWKETYTDKLFLNSTATLDGSTAGVITPTGSFATTKFVNGAAIELYNTADQTTNYERMRQYWNTNIHYCITDKGGTGTIRDLVIGTFNRQLRFSDAGSSAGFYQFLNGTGITGAAGTVFSGSWTASSGTNAIASIAPTINQSSTAGYTALLINPTETATGSGSKLLIDAKVGGVSKFKVDNTGGIETTVAGGGIIMASPDGTRYKVTVANGGTLAVAAI